MIRPSRLPLAKYCGYSVTLAERYPESSAAAERGTAYHEAMATFIKTGVGTSRFASVFATFPPHIKAEAEVKVTLCDPDTGEAISTGTLDCVLTDREGGLTIIDHKTGMPDKVDPPDDNLQLAVYGLGIALERGASKFRVGVSFPDMPPVQLSRWFHDGDDYWQMLARIKAATLQPRDEPKSGEHCNRCYSRKHCHAWALVAANAEGELSRAVPADVMGDDDKIAELILGITALEERIKIMSAHIKDRARMQPIVSGGKEYGPTMVNGRRSVSIDSLESAGLLEEAERCGAVNQGRPYEQFRWRNASGRGEKAKGATSDWLAPVPEVVVKKARARK